MAQLEGLVLSAAIRGVLPDSEVTAVSVQRYGSEALELTHMTPTGNVATQLIYRHEDLCLGMLGKGWVLVGRFTTRGTLSFGNRAARGYSGLCPPTKTAIIACI